MIQCIAIIIINYTTLCSPYQLKCLPDIKAISLMKISIAIRIASRFTILQFTMPFTSPGNSLVIFKFKYSICISDQSNANTHT